MIEGYDGYKINLPNKAEEEEFFRTDTFHQTIQEIRTLHEETMEMLHENMRLAGYRGPALHRNETRRNNIRRL